MSCSDSKHFSDNVIANTFTADAGSFPMCFANFSSLFILLIQKKKKGREEEEKGLGGVYDALEYSRLDKKLRI